MQKNRFFSICRRCFLSLFILSLFSGSFLVHTGFARACSLESIVSPMITMPVFLDGKEQEIAILQDYSFEEGATPEGQNVTAFEITSIVFPSFTGLYEEFVRQRVRPKDRCDLIKTEKFQTTTGEGGISLGAFAMYYEDRKCFPLRFFEPVTEPGVRKDPMSYLLSSGTVIARNAFSSKIQGDRLFIEMMTAYKDEGAKDKVLLERLYKEPFEGFLQDEDFMQLVEAVVSGLDQENDVLKGFVPAKAYFSKNEHGQIELSIVSQRQMSQDQLCTFRQDITNRAAERQ